MALGADLRDLAEESADRPFQLLRAHQAALTRSSVWVARTAASPANPSTSEAWRAMASTPREEVSA